MELTEIQHKPQETPSWRTWLAVIALGISSFAIVTTELAPIGLLSPLAAEFGQTEGSAGLVVTAYAWVAALAALLSGLFLGRLPRKPLLVALMLILTLSSTLVSLSTEFFTLLGARMVGALAHGAFWTLIGTIGAQLVPPKKIGLATSIIFGGVSVASVLGVPLANLLAQLDGWRSAFRVIALLSLLTTFAIAWIVPRLSSSTPVGISALANILNNPRFRRLYLATVCSIMAHFAAFTYIEPLLSGSLNIRVSLISMLLLLFGVAGVVGNIISGKFIDHYLKRLVVLSLSLMALSVLVIGSMPAGSPLLLVAILLFGWGVSVAVVFVGFQSWILREAGQAVVPALAIYVAIFNASIGAGALAGSLILSLTSLSALMVITGLAIAGSLIPVLRLKAPTS